MKDIKTVKIGKYEFLLNDNNLIIDFHYKLVLIDTKKKE